jgi:hypothetical protein
MPRLCNVPGCSGEEAVYVNDGEGHSWVDDTRPCVHRAEAKAQAQADAREDNWRD